MFGIVVSRQRLCVHDLRKVFSGNYAALFALEKEEGFFLCLLSGIRSVTAFAFYKKMKIFIFTLLCFSRFFIVNFLNNYDFETTVFQRSAG